MKQGHRLAHIWRKEFQVGELTLKRLEVGASLYVPISKTVESIKLKE